MKYKSIAMILIVAGGVLWGCYPGGAEYVEEFDLTYTNHDVSFDFGSKGTYSLPNRIVKITGNPDNPEYVNDAYATPILARIDANMQSLGWTKVDKFSNPDVELLPASWNTTTVISGGYWGSYWCWYYYYYCGGGWYYPYPIVTSYTSGTLLMTLLDPKFNSVDGSQKVVWTAAVNGLLGYTSDLNRVMGGVDQAFVQSQYLNTK